MHIPVLMGERRMRAQYKEAPKVRAKRRARAFLKQHGVLFSPCEMSERIRKARAVTENGVLLAPFETKGVRWDALRVQIESCSAGKPCSCL